MGIIFYSNRRNPLLSGMGHTKSYVLAMTAILMFSASIFYAGYYISSRIHSTSGSSNSFNNKLAGDNKSLLALKRKYEQRIDKLSERLGKVKGAIMHLNTIAQRLTKLANIDNSEFDFNNLPSIGGPVDSLVTDPALTEFFGDLDEFDKRLQRRESRLKAIRNTPSKQETP